MIMRITMNSNNNISTPTAHAAHLKTTLEEPRQRNHVAGTKLEEPSWRNHVGGTKLEEPG